MCLFYAVQTFYLPQLGIIIVVYAATIKIISGMLIAKQEEFFIFTLQTLSSDSIIYVHFSDLIF